MARSGHHVFIVHNDAEMARHKFPKAGLMWSKYILLSEKTLTVTSNKSTTSENHVCPLGLCITYAATTSAVARFVAVTKRGWSAVEMLTCDLGWVALPIDRATRRIESRCHLALDSFLGGFKKSSCHLAGLCTFLHEMPSSA